MTRSPYHANVLIDVMLPTATVATPGEQRSHVVLFPMPRVEAVGRLSQPDVVLDTGAWFVHDPDASTLPARCPSQRAAQLLADTWIGNCARETVDPSNAEQVVNWIRWFVDVHPDCAILAPLTDTPVVDALSMTAPEWPQGTDEEAAVELTTKLAAITAGPTATQASPEQGQADTDVTEEAS